MNSLENNAFMKIKKMLGEDEGQALIDDILSEMNSTNLVEPNDLLKFSLLLNIKGGLVAAIGSAIKIQAFMLGATEDIAHE